MELSKNWPEELQTALKVNGHEMAPITGLFVTCSKCGEAATLVLSLLKPDAFFSTKCPGIRADNAS